METNLIESLSIAKMLINFKRNELRILVDILQTYEALDDDLVVLLANFCDLTIKEIEALEKAIESFKDQQSIFGDTGLTKKIDIASKEDYPDNQQPENI